MSICPKRDERSSMARLTLPDDTGSTIGPRPQGRRGEPEGPPREITRTLLARGDELLVPQDPPQEFSLQRARKFRDELDDPWQLVDRDVLPTAVEDLLFQLLAGCVTRSQDDEGLDVLPADGVGNPDHAGVGHGRMLQESVFDLLGTDPVTRALDQVLLARNEAQVSVLVDRAEVADQNPPFADQGLLLLEQASSLLERTPVEGSRGAARIQPAQLSGLGNLAFLRDDLDLVPRDGSADGSGLHLPRGHARDEDVHHLGRAEALVDFLVESILPVQIGLCGQ